MNEKYQGIDVDDEGPDQAPSGQTGMNFPTPWKFIPVFTIAAVFQIPLALLKKTTKEKHTIPTSKKGLGKFKQTAEPPSKDMTITGCLGRSVKFWKSSLKTTAQREWGEKEERNRSSLVSRLIFAGRQRFAGKLLWTVPLVESWKKHGHRHIAE